VLVDRSRTMLARAERRLAWHGELPEHIRLVQADLLDLPFAPATFDSVLGLGLLHLFADLARLVAALRAQLAPGGRLFLTGLVGETRRGRRYLGALHRAGEVATPRTAVQLRDALGAPEAFRTRGCMAYAVVSGVDPALSAGRGGPARSAR
jgi:SAM-dependent methyltransferase